MGRLFDAVAALAGLRDRNTYEGQAAIELEWLATGTLPCGVYPFEIARATEGSALTVDTRPLIAAVAQDVCGGIDAGVIARRFHSTMAAIIVEMCTALREQAPRAAVVLSGGVFLNALLAAETDERLGSQVDAGGGVFPAVSPVVLYLPALEHGNPRDGRCQLAKADQVVRRAPLVLRDAQAGLDHHLRLAHPILWSCVGKPPHLC